MQIYNLKKYNTCKMYLYIYICLYYIFLYLKNKNIFLLKGLSKEICLPTFVLST